MFIGTGYGEVTLRWRAVTTTRDSTVVIGFKNNPSDNPSVIAASLNSLMTATGAIGNAAKFSSTYAWRGVRVVVERGSGPEIADVTANTIGTLVADPVPPNSAFLVRKNTLFGGRHGRGRMFLPPIFAAETAVDSVGALSGATITALQTQMTAMVGTFAGANYNMYLLHNVSEIPPYAVDTLIVQPVVATQRRRLRR
jgi:hypothetical protein